MASRFYNTEGVVLNSIRFGEGHKIVNLFTRKLGKIEASAFGVRKPGSRFGSKLEPFNVNQFLLYLKTQENPYTVREAATRSANSLIRDDLCKFTTGSCILEPVVRLVGRGQPDARLYQLLTDTLYMLNEISIEKSLYLLSIFDIKFLSVMGYIPDFSGCVNCGREMDENNIYTDPYLGFPICERCRTSSSHRIYPGALKFVRWALENPVEYARKVVMKENTRDQTRSLIENLYMQHFNTIMETWGYLNTIL